MKQQSHFLELGAALYDGERLYLSPSTAWCSLRPTWHERLVVRRGYWLWRGAK